MVLALLFGFAGPGMADTSACPEAIRAAERVAGIPPALLAAIGIVESGRPDPGTGRTLPWPWTINVEGVGSFFETRAEAVAAVQAAQAAGRRSIDVGCLQVNLMHHPGAFATLEDAFDPAVNAAYAAGFLLRLFGQSRDWGAAAAAYHSQTPGVSDEYRRRVVSGWGGAAAFGVSAWVPARPGAGLASRSIRPEPAGGYTPEFRARLARDRADGIALRIAMGILPPPRSGIRPRPLQQARLGG